MARQPGRDREPRVILRVDAHSPVPPYEQIRSQIATMAATRVLDEGTRLPAIRQLASDLGLAGGTVARAYRELEQQGVIATRGRHGTFVLGPPPASGTDEQMREAARDFAVRATQLGATQRDALDAVKRAFKTVDTG